MSDGKMWEIEDGFFSGGVGTICGVDEAGRGPLAGPVYAAAVILPPHLDIPGLTDSKKLTDKRRRELFPIIQEQAIAYGIGFATEKEIDEINILQATFLAMERALGQLAVKPDLVLIDGKEFRDTGKNRGQGGQPQRQYRRGVGACKGLPGRLYAGNGEAVPPVWL